MIGIWDGDWDVKGDWSWGLIRVECWWIMLDNVLWKIEEVASIKKVFGEFGWDGAWKVKDIDGILG